MSLVDLQNEEKEKEVGKKKEQVPKGLLLAMFVVFGVIITGTLTYGYMDTTENNTHHFNNSDVQIADVGGEISDFGSINASEGESQENLDNGGDEIIYGSLEENSPLEENEPLEEIEKIEPKDSDHDGISDEQDNCINIPNHYQDNNDGDGLGDACDSDDDNDGILDIYDTCPFESETYNGFMDSDGCADKKPKPVIKSITAGEDKFSPETLVISKGDYVRLKITNEGGCNSFSIYDLGVEDVAIPTGKTTTIEFLADKKGTFKYFCPVYCKFKVQCNKCGCTKGEGICDNVDGVIVVQ